MKYGCTLKKEITTGLWIDAKNQIHLEIDLFLKSHGYPVTEDNRQTIIDELTSLHRAECPTGMIVHTFDAENV